MNRAPAFVSELGAALREAEPALSKEFVRGARMGAMGITLNPHRLVQAYAALLQRLGALAAGATAPDDYSKT